MKKLYRLLIIFKVFLLNFCFLEKSNYIIDISSCNNLEKELKKNEKEVGMILIYSSWCYHCKEFSKTYVKLAEKYNQNLFFYAMSESTNYDKKFKDVVGYPSIYFYKNGKFSKNKGSRSFNSLSKIIESEYIKLCQQINYNEINNLYNDKYLKEDTFRNLLIGFFKDIDYINMYNSLNSNYLKKYIDLCYFCKDYEEYISKGNKSNEINIEENKILSFNKIKGNNSIYLNKANIIKNNYISFIYNNVINSYEDINSENKLYILESIKNTLLVLFIYNSVEQKQNYEEIANKLYNMNSRKEKCIFNYILFDKKIKFEKLNSMEENTIYLVDKKFERLVKLINLDNIEEIIKKNNMRLKNDVEKLIKYIFDNNQNVYLVDLSVYKYISLIIFLFILIFYLFYKIFIKYIKKGKYTIYTELTRESNVNTKIEFA